MTRTLNFIKEVNKPNFKYDTKFDDLIAKELNKILIERYHANYFERKYGADNGFLVMYFKLPNGKRYYYSLFYFGNEKHPTKKALYLNFEKLDGGTVTDISLESQSKFLSELDSMIIRLKGKVYKNKSKEDENSELKPIQEVEQEYEELRKRIKA